MSLAIWDHSVTCHPTQANATVNPIQRRILDLSTPDGQKAELT